MSGIAAVIGAPAGEPLDDIGRAMQHAMRARGEPVDAWRAGGTVLGVVRAAWEGSEAGGAGDGDGVLEDGALVVAADATLYYRADLRAALARAGHPPHGESASAMIAAAYRAWGADCAAHLEGDFAFVVWDRATRRVIGARDFGGTRTLHYAVLGGTLVVASTVGGVVAHPRCPTTLDVVHLANTIASTLAAENETVVVGVHALPSGCHMEWSPGAAPHVVRDWSPPVRDGRDVPSFDDAAAELRVMLERATTERLARAGATAVGLSGGWDSTAIFGAGQHALSAYGRGRRLRAVSLSYPPGDPGREDETITQVVDFWRQPVHWLDVREIPLLDDRAAPRDEPFVHPFESMNRSLAHGARAVDARVLLIGRGGDELFQVSPAYFSDLLAGGRWLTLLHDWRARGARGARTFAEFAVVPRLRPAVLDATAWLRGGRRVVGHLERRLPSWIDARFARRHRLLERERARAPRRGREDVAAFETRWLLTYGFFPRVHATLFDIAFAAGVEVRWPLLDRRIVEFAVRRPRWEQASGAETKRLLRRAVRGALPDAVLAPRPYRTGTTGRYFERGLGAAAPHLFATLFERPLLADLGVVDAGALRAAAERFLRGDTSDTMGLFMTVKVEQWLRARAASRTVLDLPGRGDGATAPRTPRALAAAS